MPGSDGREVVTYALRLLANCGLSCSAFRGKYCNEFSQKVSRIFRAAACFLETELRDLMMFKIFS
jgi:hypothetical protein